MFKKNIMKKLLLLTTVFLFSINLFSQDITWNGSTSTDWTNSANWSGDAPSDVHVGNIIIADVSNNPIISNIDQTIVGVLTINSGGVLTVNKTSDGSLRVSGSTANAGQVILNSGSGFHCNSDVSGSGNFVYNRNLPTADLFYAISAPVSGQDIDAFISAEPIAQNGSNMGFGTYTTASNTYAYTQSGASGTGDFVNGKGYIARVTSVGTVTFTSDASSNPSTNDVDIAVVSSGNRYNLIGNPFVSYLKTGTDHFLTDNSSKLASEKLWLWNAGEDRYDTYVTANNFFVAPGQGFYVEAKIGASGNLTFEHSQTKANNSDTFRNAVNPEVYLNISNESKERIAQVYYIEGTTTGFDNGYDGSIFESQDINDFMIYTNSVNDENDLYLAIQSVPDMDLVVPVGVNAVEGTEFTISATRLNFPFGVNVYLEDRDNSTYTLLDDESNFTTTLLDDLNGNGRFYLHTSSEQLDNDDVNEVSLNVFKADRNNFVTIQGLSGQSSVTSVKLYSILGREVLSTTLDNNTNSQSISTEGLSAGIYIIKLESANNLLTKKLIIK